MSQHYSEYFDEPCYVVSSNGFRDSVSYVDGTSRYLGSVVEDSDLTAMIHADIRKSFDERNGLPYYFISDHGNVSRRRTITLRKR